MIFTKFRIFGKFLICFRKFDWKSDTRHYFLEFGAKSGKKFIKNSQKKCKIRSVCDWINEYSLIQSRKSFGDFWRKNWDSYISSPRRIPRERCKGVHFVDLGENFPTHIFLQNLASIQKRTRPCEIDSRLQDWQKLRNFERFLNKNFGGWLSISSKISADGFPYLLENIFRALGSLLIVLF